MKKRGYNHKSPLDKSILIGLDFKMNTLITKKPLRYIDSPDTNIFKILDGIDWLSKCGTTSIRLKINSMPVADWKDAISMCESVEWENFQLDRQGDITVYLTKHYKNEYSEWNIVTDYIKDFLTYKVLPKIEKVIQDKSLPTIIYQSIQWDLVSIFQEKIYEKYNIPKFHDNILQVYEQCHFPCYWNGKFPQGRLLFY